MKKRHLVGLAVLICLGFLFVFGPSILAQTSASFNLNWHVIAGGGGPSTSASYQLNGTTGQGIIKSLHTTSASYSLDSSGYWTGVARQRQVYLPIILRN